MTTCGPANGSGPRAGGGGWLSCAAWAVAAGVSVGLVMVAKHSGVIIAPIAALLLLLRTWRVRARVLPRYLLRIAGTVVLSVLTALLTGMRP